MAVKPELQPIRRELTLAQTLSNRALALYDGVIPDSDPVAWLRAWNDLQLHVTRVTGILRKALEGEEEESEPAPSKEPARKPSLDDLVSRD